MNLGEILIAKTVSTKRRKTEERKGKRSQTGPVVLRQANLPLLRQTASPLLSMPQRTDHGATAAPPPFWWPDSGYTYTGKHRWRPVPRTRPIPPSCLPTAPSPHGSLPPRIHVQHIPFLQYIHPAPPRAPSNPALSLEMGGKASHHDRLCSRGLTGPTHPGCDFSATVVCICIHVSAATA